MNSPERSSRDRDSRADAESTDTFGAVGRYAGHGLTIGLSVALFTWLGSLLDARLGSEPLFTLSGALLGFGAGFYSMYRDLVLQPAAEEERRSEERDES